MHIYLLRGISGSGKSTWAKNFRQAWAADRKPGTVDVFSADDYFRVNGIYEFRGDYLGKAHQSCLRLYMNDLRARQEMGLGGACIVDNTNIALVDLAPYVAIAEAMGFQNRLKIMQFHNDPLKAKNVHGVPPESVARMAKNLEPLPKRWRHYEERVEWNPQP